MKLDKPAPTSGGPRTARRSTLAAPSGGGGGWLDTEFFLDKEIFLYGAVILLGAFLRLWALGDKPLHHDESIHAWYSFKLFTDGGGAYRYDPAYHGPFLYHANALMYFGNRYFTFGLGHDGFWSAYMRYMVVGAVVVALNAGILAALVQGTGIDPRLGQAISLLLITPVAFVLFKRWTFRIKPA